MGQAVAKRMIPRGRGKIINTCSLASELARATISPYTDAKGAVKMLTKAMCAEWAKHGIQANGIGPGYIRTEMNVRVDQQSGIRRLGQAAHAGRPLGRDGGAERRGGFLASDASDFVNGQIIYVDGGVLAVL